LRAVGDIIEASRRPFFSCMLAFNDKDLPAAQGWGDVRCCAGLIRSLLVVARVSVRKSCGLQAYEEELPLNDDAQDLWRTAK